MRLINADAYSAEMKDRQDAAWKWRNEAIAEEDEVKLARAEGAFTAFTEAKLTMDKHMVNPWHRVEEELPKENNCYIVYLRQGTEMRTPEWMGGEPLSYVTEMGFDKEQMLWKHGDDAYNAVLSAVDTKKDFHVTHWTERPEPPKEDE